MEIEKLDPHLVQQIAAGEVLERPANLVKELIENSVDAGASEIIVKVSKDIRSFSFKDNGRGIHFDDLPLALEQYATSKIKKSSDLWALNTFGFRGEALSCVAAVSRLKIISKYRSSEDAFEIESDFSKISSPMKSSLEVGTLIQVSDLFQNVPARLKFLKTEAAELLAIKKVFKSFCLSYPSISFQLFYDNKILMDYSATEHRRERVQNLFDLKEAFVTKVQDGNMESEIVFSSPNDVQRSSQNIWIFVQNRFIVDRSIQTAILSSYDSLLMHGEFPYVAIWIQCDPQEVDVNVHPTKSQVKFRDPQKVFRFVRDNLKSALHKAPWRKSLNKTSVDEYGGSNSKSYTGSNGESIPKQENQVSFHLPDFNHNQVQFQQKAWLGNEEQKKEQRIEQESIKDVLAKYSSKNRIQTNELDGYQESINNLSDNKKVGETFWSHLQALGQVNLTYILAQSCSSLYLVDQHAAHERLAFEKLSRDWKLGAKDVQNFLFPYTISLEEASVEKIIKSKNYFERLGFKIECSNSTSLDILSSPSIIKDDVLSKTMLDIASSLIEIEDMTAFESKINDIFATMACHSVIRAGQALSIPEMQSLLSQMDDFPLSTFCPHGRPVYIEFSFNQLDKMFGRILS